MPSPLLPFVDQAATAAQNKGNFINSAFSNIYNTKLAAAQYKRQRADALADWNMQNEYNSPQAQMQRLKDAGLNPNLVYGNGATAMSSQQPRQSDMKSVHAEAANSQGLPSIMGFYDAQVKQAQTNNLQAQLDILREQKELIAAKTTAELLGIKTKEFDLGVKSDLRSTTIETAKAQLQKIGAETGKIKMDTQFTFDENQRQQIMNERNVMNATIKATQMLLENQRIKASTDQIRQAITNMGLDARIKQAQAQMWDKGINPSWPAYQNILLQLGQKIVDYLSPSKSDVKDRLKDAGLNSLENLMLH